MVEGGFRRSVSAPGAVVAGCGAGGGDDYATFAGAERREGGLNLDV